jgi:uncharacterized coiled-coil protein SlyX
VWRRQDRIDRGLVAGLISAEKAGLVAAKQRIAELETELAIQRRAAELLGDVVPQRRFEVIAMMASKHLPVQLAARVLGVSDRAITSGAARPRRSGRSGTHG